MQFGLAVSSATVDPAAHGEPARQQLTALPVEIWPDEKRVSVGLPVPKLCLAIGGPVVYNMLMTRPTRTRAELLNVLRAHEAELRARGVETMTLFGSAARGDVTEDSDVDLVIRPGTGFSSGGFDHFERLDVLRDRLKTLLGCDVDLVEETAMRPRLALVIEQEGVRAF